MQVILLLLLSTFAFAQKKGAVQCDPVAAEKECYNLVCKATPIKPIPLDANDLAKAFKAHPYEFPETFTEELKSVGKVAESIRTFSRAKIDNNQYADEIMQDPIKLLPHMKAYFGGELKCVIKDLGCDLIVNDLANYPEGMKAFYKELFTKSLIFNESTSFNMKGKKLLLERALDEIKDQISKDEYKAEKKKIGKLKSEGDFFTYSLDSNWTKLYKAKITNDLKKYSPDVNTAFKIRAEDFLKIDLVSEGRLAYVKRTCQLGAFIQDTMNKNGTVERFNEYRDRIISSFKTNFLPKLSVESAKQLGDSITPDIFVLIENQSSIYPAKFSSKHNEAYKEPAGAAEFMNDLILLDRGEAIKCNTGGKLVSDHFQQNVNKIFISKYVLTNSYPDILTHEMGHWLSTQIVQKKMSSHSRKKLLKARDCVSEFYDTEKGKSKYFIKFDHDRFHTEEDFADWFAAKAGIGESGTFCDLKKMVNSNDLKNFQPVEGDSHSNYLFRDLNMRLNRGEVLPQSCKDLIDVYPESQPKKCDL